MPQLTFAIALTQCHKQSLELRKEKKVMSITEPFTKKKCLHTFCTEYLGGPSIQYSPHRLKEAMAISIQKNIMDVQQLTVPLKLMPTVLKLTAHLDLTRTNNTQKKVVINVLPANDHLRPSFDLIR